MKGNVRYFKGYLFCVFTLALIFCSTSAFGAIIRVPGDQPTIQAGIDAASTGDTVLVADGTYTGEGNMNLYFGGKAITVQSESGPDNCIIDGEGVGNAFNFDMGEGQDSVVSGFTIKNWYAWDSAINCYYNSSPTITDCMITADTGIEMGAITCRYSSSPTITNCILTGGGIGCYYNSSPTITDCTITGADGNGIFCWDNCSPTITDCMITGNTSTHGGGMRCYKSSPTITNCTITGNTTTEWGGAIFCTSSSPTITNCTITNNSHDGIYCFSKSSATIKNCTITGNTMAGGGAGITCDNSYATIINCIIGNHTATSDGGGIRCSDRSSPTITNCTISNNTANRNGGGIFCRDNSSPTVTNCILWADSPREIFVEGSSNPVVTYSDIEGGWKGKGNMGADPMFIGGGNYHLTALSPCIDAGTNDAPEFPSTDFEGDPRVIDGNSDGTATVDMGADEYLFVDTDADGLQDEWEMWYFGNLSQGPDDDYDGDGWTNVEEYFAGTDPTVFTVFDNHRITVPYGREAIPSGTSYTIRWVAPPEAVSFKLKYSMDNGKTWKPIASGIADTSYEWTVPTPPKNKTRCLVKVIGYDGSDKKVGADKSDSTFTIEVLRVTSPNGGETLTGGGLHTITWQTNVTKNPVETVKLKYTKNGGTTWLPIYTLTGGDPGTYDWTVPDVPKTKSKCMVKVVLKDANGNTVGKDTSDGYFTIQP
jgi:parallel beta-helix repeat protein